MEEKRVLSPCIGVCAVSGRTGLCIGCGRTLAEIAAWSGMADEERHAIMAQLAARLAAAAEPAP